MEKNEKSVFSELLGAIRYCIESKKGKYSLDTYLDIVGEYTDRLILSSQKEGLNYIGGECKVELVDDSVPKILFSIVMYFQNIQEESVKKEAHRELSCEKFTTETIENICKKKILKFSIDSPSGRS